MMSLWRLALGVCALGVAFPAVAIEQESVKKTIVDKATVRHEVYVGGGVKFVAFINTKASKNPVYIAEVVVPPATTQSCETEEYGATSVNCAGSGETGGGGTGGNGRGIPPTGGLPTTCTPYGTGSGGGCWANPWSMGNTILVEFRTNVCNSSGDCHVVVVQYYINVLTGEMTRVE